MTKLSKILIALIFTAVSYQPVTAGLTSYDCTLLDAVNLNKTGGFEPSPLAELAKGQKFSVDRHTGRITGDTILGTEVGFASTATLVVDPGSTEQAFKLVVIDPAPIAGAHALLFLISEHAKTPEKPFYATFSNTVFSGTCN